VRIGNLAFIGSHPVEPSHEVIPASQGAQILIGFDKHLLSDVLSVMEVAERASKKLVLQD